jgi:ketosteroid isomerase-like protein
MTLDDNKALVRRFYELLNDGKSESLADLFEPDYQVHFDGMPTFDGPGAVGFRSAFLVLSPDSSTRSTIKSPRTTGPPRVFPCGHASGRAHGHVPNRA